MKKDEEGLNNSLNYVVIGSIVFKQKDAYRFKFN